MKNLNYLNTIEIDEFDLIKDSKQNSTKARLVLLRPSVNTSYNIYLNNFNTIHLLPPSPLTPIESQDLNDCYINKTIPRDNLLKRIIDNQTTHFKHICPYCLLLPRTTFDHYIPETPYPVYSVLSQNLIPCCGTCNGKKLTFWRNNNSRTIIHYYNDVLPSIVFLIGSITFSVTNVPIVTFHLHQVPGINNALFEIIDNHFARLDLINRYSASIDLVVSDIVDDVEANRAEFGASLNTASISNIILNKSNRLKTHYGVNYWKSIVMDLLANSEEFINSL